MNNTHTQINNDRFQFNERNQGEKQLSHTSNSQSKLWPLISLYFNQVMEAK